jgi:hypothetical protein
MNNRRVKKNRGALRAGAAGGSGTTHARVRMYDVGFGDCFLLFLPGRGGPRKMLIDCGSAVNGKKKPAEVVGRLIADATDEDGRARIDVVVATHRHRDHISGFADRRWSEVEVGEVWMPWTEAPDDPRAQEIRAVQSRLAAVLDTFPSLKTDPELAAFAGNALTNDEALETLHHGFEGEPVRRFLPEPSQSGPVLKSDALAGITVHVLGPSRDESLLRDMNPPAGQSYLRLAGNGTDRYSLPEPFGSDWSVDMPALRLDSEDEKAIREVGDGREENLAALLDKAINSTSLVLVLQAGDACLLFPGDAQWGTWCRMLNDPDARRLLGRTNFYKIGHHGSFNATPVDFVEKCLGAPDGCDRWAMLPVKPRKRFPDIPRQPLLDELLKYFNRFARSDCQPPPAEFTSGEDFWIEAAIPIAPNGSSGNPAGPAVGGEQTVIPS